MAVEESSHEMPRGYSILVGKGFQCVCPTACLLAQRISESTILCVVADLVSECPDMGTRIDEFSAMMLREAVDCESPHELMERANRFVSSGAVSEFSTATVLFLNHRQHIATLCQAGTHPLMVQAANGEISAWGDDIGLPLGIDSDQPWESSTKALRVGERLLTLSCESIVALGDDNEDAAWEKIENILRENRKFHSVGDHLAIALSEIPVTQVAEGDRVFLAIERSQ